MPGDDHLSADSISTFQAVSSPQAAVNRLILLHDTAIQAERDALERFFAAGEGPSAQERARFRYPEPGHLSGARTAAAHPARLREVPGPGVYATT